MSSPPESSQSAPLGPWSLKGKGVEDLTSNIKNLTVSAGFGATLDTAQLADEYWKAEDSMPKMPKPGLLRHPLQGGKRSPTIFRYGITLGKFRDRVLTNRNIKQRLIFRIFTGVDSMPNHNKWATDFQTTVISAVPLFPDCHYPGAGIKRTTTDDAGNMITCNFPFQDFFNFKGLDDFFARGLNFRDLDETIRALNIISWKHVRQIMLSQSMDCSIFGNRFYPGELVATNESQKVELESRLFVIRQGFFSSMRAGESKVSLNLQPVVSAFFAQLKLDKWILRKWNSFPSKDEFERELRGVLVSFEHDKHKHSRAIWSLGLQVGKQLFKKYDTTINDKIGRGISVLAYLEEQYGQLGSFDPSVRCVNVGNTQYPSWLPIDKLTICDWQMVKTTMKEKAYVDEILRMAKRPCASKAALLDTACRYLGIVDDETRNPRAFYRNFGLTPKSQLMLLKPRKCPAPRLFGKSNQNAQSLIKVANGDWNFKDRTFHTKAQNYRRLLIISFPTKEQHDDTWVQKLNQALVKYGVASQDFNNNYVWKKISRPIPQNEKTSEYRKYVWEVLNAASKELRTDCSEDELNSKFALILVILPIKSNPLYSDVKWWGDCNVGIRTICVTQKKMTNANDEDLIANICLKFNMKLQGTSHKLAPLTGGTSTIGLIASTVVVGADVTHPSPFSNGCPSIAAVVAWYNANSEKLSLNVLFYHDGVSESQYGKVLHDELPQIERGYRAACQHLKVTASPKINITLLVVTKRHHTRFYPTKDPTAQERDSKFYKHNLPAGTMVDTDVVAPNKFNFYLQSHASPLGTAKSAHYIVLHDSRPTPYNAKDLQQITNTLCYISARATKALSVCAPYSFCRLALRSS